MRNVLKWFGIALLATATLALIVTDVLLARTDAHYRELTEAFECGYSNQKRCEADFDGDGAPTLILMKPHHDASVELPPTFLGSEPDPVSLNVFSLDNSLRTHVAVRREIGSPRLLIYEGARWPGRESFPPVAVVYAWDGATLSQVAPLAIDKEILAAMAARDDAGTFIQWVLYWMLRWPLRVAYGMLIVLLAVLYLRSRKAPRPKA